MEICPVQAMLSYLGVHGLKAGPLFITSEGRPVTRQLFASSLSAILKKALLNVTNYNTYSFAYQIHKYRCWAGGRVGPSNNMFVHHMTNVLSFLRYWQH